MNAKAKTDRTIDQEGHEVLDPRKVLTEQTLAVDLAGVEIDRAIATAHKYPRSLDVVVKKIGTLACYNEESAATCIYSLPRGSKPIIGPSIGFANIVLQSWGNCRAASQIVYIDTKQKVVIAQGAFMDLETNAQSIVPVNRRIVDKQGRLFNDDMQIVTGMAAASIARRNAILQGVPRGIWYSIWTDALNIVRGTVATFAENKDKAIKAMTQFGVKPEQIWTYLGLKGEIEMTFEHIPYVRGMYQQLRDGAITVEEMFDPRRMTGRGFETVDNPLGDAAEAPGQGDDDPTAGMGEDAPADTAATRAQFEAEGKGAKAPAPTAAQAPVAQTAKGATQAAPPAEPAQAATPGPARAEGRGAPLSTADLKNEDEYLTYWEAFLAAAGSLALIQNQWSADRKVRERCRIIGKPFDEAKEMKERREADLRKAGG